MKRGKLRWRGLGPIKANTALDNVPKKPGVYKLTFHLWGVVGNMYSARAIDHIGRLLPSDIRS
jgi:hypothetical protein